MARVQYRIGLGADDLDAVAEARELTREMPYVDTLAPAERVPLIGEERDVERSLSPTLGFARTGGAPTSAEVTPGPRLTGLSGHSGPPSACMVPRDYDGTLI